MSGPHVVGVVALMWSANPKLIGDIERTEQILIETAQPYVGQRAGCFAGDVPNDAYGYGLVDAYAAVKAALAGRGGGGQVDFPPQAPSASASHFCPPRTPPGVAGTT